MSFVKPTQITELLANIKKSFVSFFSIFMFVALGVGIFLGISWAGPALNNGADRMFSEGQFHNFQISFPYGLAEDDLKQLAHVEGVTQIEEERQSLQTFAKNNMRYTLKIQSLGTDIDTPLIVEGKLPEKPNEMAFHAESAKKLGINVGDIVTLEHDATETDNSSKTESAHEEDGKDADSNDSKNSSTEQDANSDGMKLLTRDTFTVTAIINTADYVAVSSETYGYSNSPSGMVDALAWVPIEAFDAEAFHDGYPIVNVRCESLADLETFSKDYEAKSSEIKERIADLGKELAVARYDQLHENAQAKVDEAEQKLNDGKAQIENGEKQIEEGEAQIEQARTELDNAVAAGQAELANAYNVLIAGENAKADAEGKLSSAQSKLDKAQAALDEVDALKSQASSTAQEMKAYKAEQDKALASGKIDEKTYNENLDKSGAQMLKRAQPIAERAGVTLPGTIDHTNYGAAITALEAAVANVDNITVEIEGNKMTIGEAREKTAQLGEAVSSAQSELNAKSAELSSGWSRYYAGQQELEARKAQGEQKIADGQAKLEDAKKQVDDAKAQVAENEPKLEDAKAKLAEMQKYDWTVLARAHNAGTTSVTTFSDVTNNLSISMAALFIIVGLLVSYFAVSRLVHEQVIQIGTKKALGFRKGEITLSFLLYSGIAVLAGAIIGAIVGYLLVEGIIGGVLASMFAFGAYPPYFGWTLFIIMTVLELGLILGATYFACRNVLKQHAVELLRGEKPPTGKARFYERWNVWDKLPLFIQTIVNNCINDKRRMLSTIVGVAGSTALIVTAITLNNDVLKSYDAHYEDTYGFNAIAYIDNTVADAADSVESTLRAEGADASRVLMKHCILDLPNGNGSTVRIVVPLDESTFDQLYHVNPTMGASFDPSSDGAWISQAYAEHTGAKVGDALSIGGDDGAKHEVPIVGIYEFWLTYHEVVMGVDYYQKEFGEASPNALLVQTGDADFDSLKATLSNVAGFDSFVDDAKEQHRNFETFSRVSSAVVAIYLALAALMAIVVLLNLNVMFIEEKKRELIVLMINGFSVKQAKNYISYDSIVLTILGILIGIILGCTMGSITVAAVEPSTSVFMKSPDAWAIIIGIAGSAILALIMCVIALRRIPKFSLTDINKV